MTLTAATCLFLAGCPANADRVLGEQPRQPVTAILANASDPRGCPAGRQEDRMRPDGDADDQPTMNLSEDVTQPPTARIIHPRAHPDLPDQPGGPPYEPPYEPLWDPPSGPLDPPYEPLGRAYEPRASEPVDLPDEPLDPPDTSTTVKRHLRRTTRGPLRRFTLYASGVETRVLWYAPIDESEYVVQGSLVTLTAIVAAVSGLAAASFLIAGHFVLTPVTVLIGLAWGLLIFFFDRALVSGTFNPYRFTRAEVDSLRDPEVATPWAHLVTTDLGGRRGVLRRIGEIVRVSLVASLRVALALATSYIAAEMVLFLVFQPEVNARAAYLEQQMQAQRVAAIQSDFTAASDKRAGQRKELTGASDPDVLRLSKQTTDLTTQVDAARKDLGILQAAAAAEHDGDKYQNTLSDGTIVKTTGKQGDGAAARSLAQRRDTQQGIVNDLASRLSRSRTALDARLADIKKKNAPALSTLESLDNQATVQQQATLTAAVADPSAIHGLLIRQAALDRLAHDRNPETVVDDPIKPCTGFFSWFCAARNALIPPTPMGPVVAAYRVIFFVIEILPITYKVIASLRRRRPYDVAKAALEEANNIDSIRLLDRHLHDAAREVMNRSNQRQTEHSARVAINETNHSARR